MSEYLENKYAEKVKLIEIKNIRRPWFKVNIVCELEDDSEMYDTIELESILEDELYFLVLCYIFNWDDSFLQDNPESDEEAVAGYKVAEDINFPWLYDYLMDVGLSFGEPEDPDVAYSEKKPVNVYGKTIFYYDGENKYRVSLPDMNDLFDSREEMRKYMNNLYNKTLTNES